MTTLKDTKLGDRVKIWLDHSFHLDKDATHKAMIVEATVIGIGRDEYAEKDANGNFDEEEPIDYALGWRVDQSHPYADDMMVRKPDEMQNYDMVSNRLDYAWYRSRLEENMVVCEILPPAPSFVATHFMPKAIKDESDVKQEPKWIDGTLNDVKLGDKIRVYLYQNGKLARGPGKGRTTIEQNGKLARGPGKGRTTIEATVIGLENKRKEFKQVLLGWKTGEDYPKEAVKNKKGIHFKQQVPNDHLNYQWVDHLEFDDRCQILANPIEASVVETQPAITTAPAPKQASKQTQWVDTTVGEAKLGEKVRFWLTPDKKEIAFVKTDETIEMTVIGLKPNQPISRGYYNMPILLGRKGDDPNAPKVCGKAKVAASAYEQRVPDYKGYNRFLHAELNEPCQVFRPIEEPLGKKVARLVRMQSLFNDQIDIEKRSASLGWFIIKGITSPDDFDSLIVEGLHPEVVEHWKEHNSSPEAMKRIEFARDESKQICDTWNKMMDEKIGQSDALVSIFKNETELSPEQLEFGSEILDDLITEEVIEPDEIGDLVERGMPISIVEFWKDNYSLGAMTMKLLGKQKDAKTTSGGTAAALFGIAAMGGLAAALGNSYANSIPSVRVEDAVLEPVVEAIAEQAAASVS